MFNCNNFILKCSCFIGLDQQNFIVNELDGSVTVCVLFLDGTGIEDTQISIDAAVSVISDTASGTYSIIVATCMTLMFKA